MADMGGLPLPKSAQVTPTHSADAWGIVGLSLLLCTH